MSEGQMLNHDSFDWDKHNEEELNRIINVPVKPVEGETFSILISGLEYSDKKSSAITNYLSNMGVDYNSIYPAPVNPSMQSVEEAAKAHADKKSYQSDKHRFTITPWIQHNWAISDFKAGAEWQAQVKQPVMQWVKEKPKLNKECIILTSTTVFGEMEYNSFLVVNIKYEFDTGSYFSLCTMDGEHWGDIEDLQADLYQVIDLPEPPIQ